MAARTVYAVLEETARTCGKAPALHQPIGKGALSRPTVGSNISAPPKKSRADSAGSGIRRGDTVALHSETRAEFYLADLGVLANGSIAAALYTSYPAADQAEQFAREPRQGRFR